MKKILKKFKIKILVGDKYVKEEVEHEPENAAENEDEYSLLKKEKENKYK